MGQGSREITGDISYNGHPGMFEQKEIIETFQQFLTSTLSFEAVREALIRAFSDRK